MAFLQLWFMKKYIGKRIVSRRWYYRRRYLENLKTIKEIPKKIKGQNIPKLLEIRCEIFISKKIFLIKKDFANPRNAAGGSLRQKNPSDTSKIFLQYLLRARCCWSNDNGNSNRIFNKISDWNFKVNNLSKTVSNIEEIGQYNKIDHN